MEQEILICCIYLQSTSCAPFGGRSSDSLFVNNVFSPYWHIDMDVRISIQSVVCVQLFHGCPLAFCYRLFGLIQRIDHILCIRYPVVHGSHFQEFAVLDSRFSLMYRNNQLLYLSTRSATGPTYRFLSWKGTPLLFLEGRGNVQYIQRLCFLSGDHNLQLFWAILKW